MSGTIGVRDGRQAGAVAGAQAGGRAAGGRRREARRCTGRAASTGGPRGPPGTSVRRCTRRRCSRRPWPGCCAGSTRRWAGPASLDFVDMAAGRGELATGVLGRAARRRGRPHARVRRRDRRPPRGPRPRIEWLPEPPRGSPGCSSPTSGWTTSPWTSRRRTPRACRAGCSSGRGRRERLGEPVAGAEARVARAVVAAAGRGRAAGGDRPAPGRRRGRPRSPASARGLAVAVDYAHTRRDARPPFGTLTGFREGRETAPVPDGSCDITAHVALDACAGARTGRPTGARLLTPTRTPCTPWASPGARPPLALASTRPRGVRARPGGRRRGRGAHRAGRAGRLRLAAPAGGNRGPARHGTAAEVTAGRLTGRRHGGGATCRCPRRRRTVDPRIATMSATSVPGSSSVSAWMLLYDAERSFSRYGVFSPLQTR